MIKVTYETKRGTFTEEYDRFGFKVGDRVFVQSPFYNRRGTYKVINIETDKKEK